MKRLPSLTLSLGLLTLGAGLGLLAQPRLSGQPPLPPVEAPAPAPAPAAPVAVPGELTSYRDIVKRVLPAVVSIEARTAQSARNEEGDPRIPRQNLPEDLRRFFGEGGVPRQQPTVGFGSGFLVDSSGVILTNYHVVADAEQVTVSLNDGRKLVSRDITIDRKTDLAIVRVKSDKPLPFLDFADSEAVEVGDRVLAVGAPFGLTGSVTHGIISAKSRDLRMNDYEDFIQTDAAINPGNSGGPLVGLDGRVVGVNSAIKSRSGGFQGVGLAISANLARSVKEQLTQNGTVRRGYLGLRLRELTAELAERLGVAEGTGVIAAQVLENAPAAKGGVKEGDIITAIDGKAVRSARELQRAVANLPADKQVRVLVSRNGQNLELPVTIEPQPEDMSADSPQPRRAAPRPAEPGVALPEYGLTVDALTPDTAGRLGFEAAIKGVVVTRVTAGGPADAAGIARNMAVTHVDKTAVESPAAFREAMAKADAAKGALLQVRLPQGGVDFILIKPSR